MNCKQPMCDPGDRHVHERRYHIFLLTCWLEDEGDMGNPESWRFRLEEPKSGLRRGCVGAQRLIALLCDEIAGDEIVGEIVEEFVRVDCQTNSRNEGD